jgi:Na+-translocating ferredoxin:NAD+ oxidoreductase RnfD subunit
MEAIEQGEVVAAAPSRKQWFTANYFSYVPPAFITLILLVGQIAYGILDNYVNVIAAILTSLVSELVLARFVLGTKKNLASAYVTGISVGILIRSNILWPYIFTALISIMSKYVMRYKGRHLWNPSNFGVSWMLLVAGAYVAGLSIQWGSNFAAMGVIWFLGMGLVYRAKKIHVTLTYVGSFIILAYVRSLINNDTFFAEVSPLTGPMYQLFIFFMITDPGVAVSTKKGQMIVVAIVALAEFVLRLEGVIYAPFYALCVVGPVARFIDLRMNSPKPVPVKTVA